MKVIDMWYSSIISLQISYIIYNVYKIVISNYRVRHYLQWTEQCCVCGPITKLAHALIDQRN